MNNTNTNTEANMSEKSNAWASRQSQIRLGEMQVIVDFLEAPRELRPNPPYQIKPQEVG